MDVRLLAVDDHTRLWSVVRLHLIAKGREVRTPIVGSVAIQVIRARYAAYRRVALRGAASARETSVLEAITERGESRANPQGSHLLTLEGA